MSVQVIRFAPGLKPVLKHGTHDQSTHGNWADGNVGNFTLDASSDPMGLTTYNHPNGSRVIFQGIDNYYDGDGKPTPEKKARIEEALAIVDSLQSKYPIKDLTIVFENDPNGENAAVYPVLGQTVNIGRETAPQGMTVIYPQNFLSPQLPRGKEDAPYIVINSQILGSHNGQPYTYKTITEENGNFYNPNHVVKGDSGLLKNVLTHEYGHALDNNSQQDSLNQWYDATEQNTSSYGLSNKREFFAETFTAWQLDKTNPKWQESFKITDMASLGSKVNKAAARGFIVKDRFDGGEPFLQEFGEVLKHEGGGHDQKTHGNWADSGSPKLTILGKNDGVNESFNESTRVVRYQPKGKQPVDYVLYDDTMFNTSKVVAYVKPAYGKTIDGYSESRTTVGTLLAVGPGKNPWRSSAKDDNKGTITDVAVSPAHQRRGLASAMLKFHRDRYPEWDIQHSHALLPDGKAWADVVKHGEGDQKPHGNWAHNGNGLGIEEVMRLHKSSDPLQSKVYEAEQSIDAPSKNPLEKPTNPKRDNFQSTADYEKAWKDYNKKWMAWAVEAQAIILSKTGKAYLDGTPAGVKKYVEQVIKQDWFVERFGNGSSLPKLEVKTSNTNASGRHILKMQKDRASGRIIKTVHEISLDRQSVKNERTILHEISHYATAISQTESFAAHGVEFARNHLFVVEQAVGSARAQTLESAYTAKGVLNGN